MCPNINPGFLGSLAPCITLPGKQLFRAKDRVYLGGIDLAEEAEEEEGARFRVLKLHRDSTVVTTGEVYFPSADGVQKQPRIKVVEYIGGQVRRTRIFTPN